MPQARSTWTTPMYVLEIWNIIVFTEYNKEPSGELKVLPTTSPCLINTYNYRKRAQAGSSRYRWGPIQGPATSCTRSLPTSVTWGSRQSVALHIY